MVKALNSLGWEEPTWHLGGGSGRQSPLWTPSGHGPRSPEPLGADLSSDPTSPLPWPAQLGSLGPASAWGTRTRQYRWPRPQARLPHLRSLSV